MFTVQRIKRQTKSAVKSIYRLFLWIFLQERAPLDRIVNALHAHGCVRVDSPAQQVGETAAFTAYSIAEANCLYWFGAVYDSQRRLIAETVSEEAEAAQTLLLSSLEPLPQRTSSLQNVLLLTAHHADRYFHWMIDVVPRLAASKFTWDGVDIIFVPSSRPFQKELLAKLHVPLPKLSPDQPWDLHRTFKRVYFVENRNVASQHQLKASVQVLRELYSVEIQHSDGDRLKLFCLRGRTDTRQILNESEVALLVESHGYQIVDCATLTVAEQATLFARAAIITGAHGAAFTNIVFANRGTLIHEWFPATYENNCLISSAAELRKTSK